MSLDICPAAKDSLGMLVVISWDGCPNITHNCRPQIVAAGADPWEFHGRLIADTLDELLTCYQKLRDPQMEKQLKALDPKNGWGGLGDSREFIGQLTALAREFPNCWWSVSR